MRPLAAVLTLFLSLVPSASRGFRQAAAGTPVPDRAMRTIDGKKARLLAEGKVNVLVFVRTGQDHSESALRQLAQLERELERKPVRFAAIVSDTEVPEDVRRLAREAALAMPVLVDDGDALYGELGVAMFPSVGVVGKDGRLAAYQPFRKVNYLDAMRAQVRVALGELDAAALARVLDPGIQEAPSGGRARARLRLARTLLAADRVDGAVENARAAVALEPELADAHRVLSEALARAGKCDEAAKEAATARRLAPAEPPTALACRR